MTFMRRINAIGLAVLFLAASGLGALAHGVDASARGLNDHQHFHCHQSRNCHSHNHDASHH